MSSNAAEPEYMVADGFRTKVPTSNGLVGEYLVWIRIVPGAISALMVCASTGTVRGPTVSGWLSDDPVNALGSAGVKVAVIVYEPWSRADVVRVATPVL